MNNIEVIQIVNINIFNILDAYIVFTNIRLVS